MMTKENLIEALIKDGYLKTPAVIEAFQQIDRKDFVTEEAKAMAYENTALPIGYQQTISQPLVVAFMLELLDAKPGEKILDVGTGSGWNAALLAYLVGKPRTNTDGTRTDADNKSQRSPQESAESAPLVVSIERVLELYKFAKKNLGKYFLINSAESVSGPRGSVLDESPLKSAKPGTVLYPARSAVSVKLIQGDGSKGYKDQAPFDKIIAAASAGEIPEAWKEQLKINGRIVAPVKDSIVVWEKISKDNFEKKEYFGFAFVPLVRG